MVDYDFFSPAAVPGRHDVIALGMVLHDWGLPRKMQLLRKVRGAGRVWLSGWVVGW